MIPVAPRRDEALRRKSEYEREMAQLLLEIPGLELMAAEFQIKSLATQWYVLNARDPALKDMRPVDCLRRIMQIIRGYGEQGAV